MQGTGASENPYLVKSIIELREAATKSGAYVKVIADLDCNEENYLEWETLNITAKEIDFDGKSLINPHIKRGNVLFNGGYIKNGKILNVYENEAHAVALATTFEYVTLTAYLARTTGKPFGNVGLLKCNFEIDNKNLNKQVWFEPKQGVGVANSRLKLTGSAPNGVIQSWNTNFADIDVLDGSRVEGKITGLQSGTYVANGKISNSVIALDTTDAQEGATLARMVSNATVYQSDISGLSNHKEAIPCTHNEIRDPDSLNSKGFVVVEVK